ncbi:MAG: hypothetical protein COV29_01310 [Candidatus Yanofskybacteria bacterium CG10_big_fil_rev_8_21_14_0_10_36_16]|uniref:Adenylate kinase n=1 Tax=Candidatus Yanofskybacteria bacterium CG10_big_fil_rev_8_21_14_0_10_36_16 TaxID=1975096 RepID=A0A2J0Q882_9BACT|nr:MAG: hypothetical protein COV29_01310 [Candidatus Yanofskybacteria bacterium CG10_big_fil_rev_8_21_14_0_10_36_16]
MVKYPNKRIISLIGPPGSGKGTQADLLSEKIDLIHFDTGKFFRSFFNSYNGDDKEILEQKEVYDTGELLSPPFVARLVLSEVEKICAKESGIVFSGSPRTMYETGKELPAFGDMVGIENVFIFYISLSKAESIKRNSARLVCEAQGHSISNLPEDQKHREIGACPKDGSKLKKRDGLDDPEIIAKRYDVYLRDTKPILDKAKSMGYKVVDINGEQAIEDVSNDILKHLKPNN